MKPAVVDGNVGLLEPDKATYLPAITHVAIITVETKPALSAAAARGQLRPRFRTRETPCE